MSYTVTMFIAQYMLVTMLIQSFSNARFDKSLWSCESQEQLFQWPVVINLWRYHGDIMGVSWSLDWLKGKSTGNDGFTITK